MHAFIQHLLLIGRNAMKWTFLIATFCVSQMNPLFSKEPKKISSFEEKLKRLEEDSGIDIRKEKTTIQFSGEFIYWKTSLDGVAYATTAKLVEDPSGDLILNKFKTRTVHFDYDPAFRVGLGIGLPHDYWDISLSWLRSFTKGRDTAHGEQTLDPGNRLILDSIGLIEGLDTPPSKAKAQCDVHLDLVDAVLGRTFLWSRFFTFRPYAGLRGAWVRLDWDISFTRPISIPSPLDQSYTKVDVENDFTGCGFVGGFDSKWNIYKGFGLYSRASAALIYGNSLEETKQKFVRIPPNQNSVFKQTLTARNSAHAVKGVFDIALGIKWEADFYKTNHIFLWAGYDFFYWPNVTQKTINQETRSRDRADLSFEGFVTGARIEF